MVGGSSCFILPANSNACAKSAQGTWAPSALSEIRMTCPDTILLKRYIQHRSPILMGQLYDRVAPQLLSLALHLTKNPTQAEDLVQEVFLQAIQDCEQWDSVVSVASWMSEILACNYEVARAAGQRSTSLVDLSDKELMQDRHDPVTEAEYEELHVRLELAIECLPDRYRSVVQLLVLEGLNSEEAGEALDRSPATVRSQLSRGLDRLRQILPAALGLGIWSVTQTRGTASPLEAMRARFMDEAQALPTPGPAGSSLNWMTAAKAVGVCALIVGAASLGNFLLRTQESSPGVESSYPPAVLAKEIPLVVPATNGAGGQRAAASSEIETVPSHPIQISGAVVGAFGESLSGAEVVIYYWEPWCDAGEETRIDELYAYGWKTTTDDEGRYSLGVPCLPPGPPTLCISAGDGHTESCVRFAAKLGNLEALVMGENEIPVTKLIPAGSVSGVLLRHDGTPAHPACFQISPGQDPRYPNRFAVERDGSFHLERVPAGIHIIELSMGGVVRQTTLNVRAGADNRLPVVSFPKPNPLRIRVVDTTGLEVEKAVIEFSPLNPGQKSHFFRYLPDEMGAMDTNLPAANQHEVIVSAEGYAPEKASYRLAQGEHELVVQMHQVRMIAVRAVHAESGEPIKRYTLQEQRFEERCWQHSGRAPTHRPGKDGTMRIPFKSGARCVVASLGLQDAIISFDADCPDYVEVAMLPAPRVEGRILRGASPAKGLRIEICPLEIYCEVDGNPETMRAQIAEHAGKCLTHDTVWTETDGEGRFVFDANSKVGLWYRIRSRDQGNQAIEHWFRIDTTRSSIHDLGDLRLAPAGILRGRVQVPDGVNPADIVFILDLDSSSHTAVTDAEGEFEFKDIVPGKHYLHMQRTTGLAQLADTCSFVIEPNQTLEQTFDLRTLGLSQRHLRLTENGVPLAYHRVFLRTNLGHEGAWEECQLGVTDVEGNVVGELPANGSASVWVKPLSGGTYREHATAVVPLTCKTLPPILVAF